MIIGRYEKMDSKEIIKRVIEFNNPPRIGYSFTNDYPDDFKWIRFPKLINKKYEKYRLFGKHDEILKQVPWFDGEVLVNDFGCIYGRLNKITKGECIKGSLEEGWENLDGFEFPEIDRSYHDDCIKIIEQNQDKFLLAAMPIAIFSTIRDIRKIDNVFMDTVLEKENLNKFLKKFEEFGLSMIDEANKIGFEGVIYADDWGDQKSIFISPESFREIFKPIYKSFADKIHEYGMKMFLHSCGNIYSIIEDFIEVGVDVLQLDQPELLGVEKLASDFGGRITFWSPVDIQKVMPTGKKDIIIKEAKKMTSIFRKFKGGFIAKDYPSWGDIGVKDEWAKWARQELIKRSKL